MRLRPGRASVPVVVAAGERVLAWADTDGGPVGGTRDALYLPGPGSVVRVPWQEVETAEWDVETGVLVVREVGRYGEVRPEHTLTVEAPGRLLELLRERVTASILLTRRTPVSGRLGVTVIGRRAPSGERETAWFVDYDADLDPDDPVVVGAVEAALAGARAEVGEL